MMRFRWIPLALPVLALVLTAPPAAPACGDGGGAATATEAGAQALALGATAPMQDVKMKAADGKTWSVATAAGKKGTLVVFICNHCPWVKAWQGRIAAIGAEAVDSGIGVIAINSNDPDQFPADDFAGMVARAQQLKLRFPYAMDATSDVGRAFGATHTPEAFLFDAGGRLVYHGAVDDNAQEPGAVTAHWLHDAVVAVAAGKPVANAETKALGCSMKLRAAKS